MGDGNRRQLVNSSTAWNFYMSNAKDTTKLPLRVFSSYGINGWCYQPWTQVTTDPYYVCSQQLIQYSNTASIADYLTKSVQPNQNLAGETPLMGDAIRIDGWPLPVDQGPAAGGYTLTTGSINQYTNNNMGRWVLNRHGKNANMAFMGRSRRANLARAAVDAPLVPRLGHADAAATDARRFNVNQAGQVGLADARAVGLAKRRVSHVSSSGVGPISKPTAPPWVPRLGGARPTAVPWALQAA